MGPRHSAQRRLNPGNRKAISTGSKFHVPEYQTSQSLLVAMPHFSQKGSRYSSSDEFIDRSRHIRFQFLHVAHPFACSVPTRRDVSRFGQWLWDSSEAGLAARNKAGQAQSR
jgi:hypothetical protein